MYPIPFSSPRIKTYRSESIRSVPYIGKIEELRGLTTTAWSMVWRLLKLELALLIASLYNIKNKIKFKNKTFQNERSMTPLLQGKY